MSYHCAPIIIGFILIIFNCFDFTMSCTPGQARLVNGTSKSKGVLEVCTVNSTWSTVCTRYASCNSYKVACRQAGFNDAVTWASNYTAWRMSKPKVGFYSCSGSENSLFNCTKIGEYDGYSSCWGVISLTCSNLPKDSACTTNDVRLFGGNKKSEGQLQLCWNGQWRDVCDYYSYRNAQTLGHIACKQLGYSGEWVSTTHNGHFYKTNSSLLSSGSRYYSVRLYCYSNNYNSISACSKYYSSCGHMCYESEVAISCVPDKANCKQNELRLVGGRNALEGWVEVCVDGVWGRVSGKAEGNAVDVICSTLGFNETGAKLISTSTARHSYKFKTINSPPLVKYINCCDRDKAFYDCDIYYSKKTDRIPHDQDLAIGCIDGCTTGKTRLVGGDTKHEGIVEVCVNGVWMTVGLSEWDEIDANVVCQNLYSGQKYAYAIPTNSSEFNTVSSRDIYYNHVRCNGAETSIYNCYKGWSTFVSGPSAAVRCQPLCDCSSFGGA